MKYKHVPLLSLCRPKQWPTLSAKELRPEGFPVYGANGPVGFSDRYTHEKPVLLVGCRGSCGSLHITPPRVYATGNAMALDELDESSVDIRYLYYYFQRRGFADVVSGSSQPQITRQGLSRVSVPLPEGSASLLEQRRIAEILDRADAIRCKRRETIALTEELVRSTFLEMFGDPVSNSRGWPTKRIGDLLSFLTSGSRGWAEYYAKTGDAFLRIQNVRSDRLDLADIAFVRAPPSAEARRTETRAGDVLLSITADLGRTAVIPDSLGRAYINQHLAILRPRDVNSEYLSSFLASEGGRRQVLGRNKGGVKAGLNFEDIRSIDVPLPPSELQTAYAAAKSRIRTLEVRFQGAASHAEQLFQSLLRGAFGDVAFTVGPETGEPRSTIVREVSA